GYRYLHGLVGSCALLAAYGWREAAERRGVRSFVSAASLVTVFGSIPFLTWQATAFVRPYARVSRMIDGIRADMVVANKLRPADVRELCSRGTIAFVDVPQMQALGLGFGNVPDPAPFNALRGAAPDRCRR